MRALPGSLGRIVRSVSEIPAVIVAPLALSRTLARIESRRAHPIGLVLGAVAGLHQGVIASTPTNDDFMHMALANQMLAGDWPLRDYFDLDGALMHGISAAAQLLLGHRLLSEAVVVAVMMGVSTYLVFALVRALTGSTTAAVLSAVLLVVAGPRGFSYPKIIVYAAAASIWWWYVRKPTRGRILMFGTWVAIAFYWRADHGVYVAASVLLAVVAAHGVGRLAAIRLGQAAVVSLALVLPMLVLASAIMGLGAYIQSGLTILTTQHTTESTQTLPRWPIRSVGDVIRLDAPEEFAPTVSLRWTEDSSAEARASVLSRYGLTPLSNDGPSAQVVRLSSYSSPLIRDVINEPIVADTAGIDRSQSAIPWSAWPLWERFRFSYWWLRFRLFPAVNEHVNASEATAAFFYALPLLVVATGGRWLRRYLNPVATGRRLAAFATLGLVTAVGLMRSPYDVRAVDNVVVPAILFGCFVTGLWRTARAAGGTRRWLLMPVTVLFALLVVKSVAVAGQFGDRVGWLTGEGRSVARMKGAWREVRDRLVAEPPLTYWHEIPKSPELQLAQYATECLPSSERLLVLWFAPEIYYYSDRLMASRHLFYESGYQLLAHEQQLTLEKLHRAAPPLVFASGALDTFTRLNYPAIVEYVRRDYERVATLEDGARQYQILLRRNAPVLRSYRDSQWPCLI